MRNYKTITTSGAIVIFLALLPLFLTRTDVMNWLTFTLLYVTLSQSWNILGGYAGQQNLGHAAFFGLGALSARYCWLYGLPLPLALIAGGVAASVFAIIIGFPAFRLKGVYFVIGTLVLAEILKMTFYTILPVASLLPPDQLNNYSLIPRYYVSLIIAILSVIFVSWISRSRLGLGFMSIRQNEDAAGSLGVNILKYKLTAFIISTFMAGLAGGIYSYYASGVMAGYLFSPVWTFDAVLIVFVGGVGTVVGPIIGSVFFVFLKQLLSVYLPGVHVLVFGILFVVVVLFLPGGLIGLMTKIRASITRAGVS